MTGRSSARPLKAASAMLFGALLVGLIVAFAVLDGRDPGTAAASPGDVAADSTTSEVVNGPSGSVDATPQPSSGATPGGPAAMAPDTIAAVTAAGANLRVRTGPGTGTSVASASLLPAGERLLVVAGPVAADGYDWYEVQVDPRRSELFGWVAAGADGERWIEPVALECGDAPDAEALLRESPIELLACFGALDVKIRGKPSDGLPPLSEGAELADYLCPELKSSGGCSVDEPWLLVPNEMVELDTSADNRYLPLAATPDMGVTLRELPMDTWTPMRIALDVPEARRCRVVNPDTGEDVIPRSEAITRCRTTLVLVEVAP